MEESLEPFPLFLDEESEESSVEDDPFQPFQSAPVEMANPLDRLAAWGVRTREDRFALKSYDPSSLTMVISASPQQFEILEAVRTMLQRSELQVEIRCRFYRTSRERNAPEMLMIVPGADGQPALQGQAIPENLAIMKPISADTDSTLDEYWAGRMGHPGFLALDTPDGRGIGVITRSHLKSGIEMVNEIVVNSNPDAQDDPVFRTTWTGVRLTGLPMIAGESVKLSLVFEWRGTMIDIVDGIPQFDGRASWNGTLDFDRGWRPDSIDLIVPFDEETLAGLLITCKIVDLPGGRALPAEGATPDRVN